MEQAEKLTRLPIPALDEILGHPFKVLDQGFVRVVDYKGSDAAIVQAARVSYGAGTKKVSEDEGLIRFLMRHRHTTPFEMCEIKLHVRVPMDCWRQWIRHRTANVNEYSTRYSEAIDANQTTAPDEWRSQSKQNKQGSEGMVTEWPEGTKHITIPNRSTGKDEPAIELDGRVLTVDEPDITPGQYLTEREAWLHGEARKIYEERLKFDVAREQARKDLLLSTYTEAYWKIDLHNLFHFLSLRMDAHAQLEIRSYADIIGKEIVAKWVPAAWAAFQDYRLGASFISARDKKILYYMNVGRPDTAIQEAEGYGWLEGRDFGKLKSNRERTECEAKLEGLGLVAPWNDSRQQ